jgi:hypothetical protein
MNNILQLKGDLQDRSSSNTPGPRNIPKNEPAVTSKKLGVFAEQLQRLADYWAEENLIRGCLIDVCYIDVIAKSNRIQGYFSGSGKPNDYIVGARFVEEDIKKHVITYHISDEMINGTIKKLRSAIKLLDEEFDGSITYDSIDSLKDNKLDYQKYGIKKTIFTNIIVDTHYIQGFETPDNSANANDQSIITVYRTNAKLVDLMSSIGIHLQPNKILTDTTMLLFPNEIKLLKEKAPYLIAMATEDISKLSYNDVVTDADIQDVTVLTIPSPNNEPIIGVIDTLFDESVYFSDWVTYEKKIAEAIPVGPEDYVHGTAVSSIIVDGPSFNPHLDDGCGRFRVKHFGVTPQREYSASTIMKKIEEIVIENPDIKVWNLSLGSDREINLNLISPEAAILDKIQYDNDVIFVVAGTNKRKDDNQKNKRIGSPADSINSLVVNSVNKEGNPASYSRKGLVLSFFNKPDICSYGGDTGDYMRVCAPLGEILCSGTSYAAPWITRKVAYLIEVLGLSREVAKALIVDAAAGWKQVGADQHLALLVGHGVVPQRIEDIIKTDDDEIKFIINGISEKWDTYTYNLPVPIHKNKHPFVAKATMCYFPSCSINQGVDYTNTELDICFGRIKDGSIKPINKNYQSVEDGVAHYIYEGTAREVHRKWDNTKHISERLTSKVRAREVYEKGLWGISVKAKARLKERDENLKFGLIVTLKEINGVNRIDDFIRQCELRGWLISRVDVESRIDIYNKAQETVTFDT